MSANWGSGPDGRRPRSDRRKKGTWLRRELKADLEDQRARLRRGQARQGMVIGRAGQSGADAQDAARRLVAKILGGAARIMLGGSRMVAMDLGGSVRGRQAYSPNGHGDNMENQRKGGDKRRRPSPPLRTVLHPCHIGLPRPVLRRINADGIRLGRTHPSEEPRGRSARI